MFSMFRPGWTKRANTVLDALLYWLSIFGVPVVIGVVSIMAMVAWQAHYFAQDATQLEFRVVEDRSRSLGPAQALAELRQQPAVAFHDTKLSVFPFWIAFPAAPSRREDRTDLELPSRHAQELTCWNGSDLRKLGHADRAVTSGQIIAAKAGFAIEFNKLQFNVNVLCRGVFVGPARISVMQWPESQLDISIHKFHRDSGLLEGGLIVLTLFVLLTAVINREWIYVLFAAWLVANLRLGAISAGWDTLWFGYTIPLEWIHAVRKLTIATYFLLTYALFARLFRDDIEQVGFRFLLRLAQWSCIPFLIVAAVLPYSNFIPYMWVTVAVGTFVIAFFLARIVLVTRSKVAIWYSASIGIALFAISYEVIAAALGAKFLIGAVNSATAALFSSLLASLAIAEEMKEERLEKVKAQAELRSTYEAIPIGLFTLDLAGKFLRGNPTLKAMLRVDVSGKKAERWSDYFEPGAWDRLLDLARAEHGVLELQGAIAGGEEPKWYLVEATLANEKIEGSLQDITERAKATARLRFLADHDPLTAVLNRRGIENAYDDAIKGIANGHSLALAYLDLDRFKLINDLYGHLAGDEVLKQVCERIKEMLSPGQEIGRIGGDEFVILFRDAPIASATKTCHDIVDRIVTLPFRLGDKAFQIKGSMGLIEIATGIHVKDAISAADNACREAKKGLHGDLVIYEKNAPVFKERQEELRLVEHLGAGVAPEGLFLVMQPMMSLAAPYDSLNFEILLRLREPDGTISPAWKIISAAERNGRSAVVDRWVMSNALEWLDTHHDRLGKTRFACMNLSGASLNDERFIEDAFAMLAQHGRATERLCVEITESVALHDLDNTRRFIDKVRSFGAKIALDDFGAGYTSFAYLKELRADTLKIDGSFVVGVNAHPTNLSIVQTIAELARNLGMKSVAEWAEDLPTLQTLVEVGVDYVQGYVVARPQLPEAILVADSSASFITDDKVAQYVRDSLATGQERVLWDSMKQRNPKGIH
jgi:diguanylate cyclase (GGDEF)-like protein